MPVYSRMHSNECVYVLREVHAHIHIHSRVTVTGVFIVSIYHIYNIYVYVQYRHNDHIVCAAGPLCNCVRIVSHAGSTVEISWFYREDTVRSVKETVPNDSNERESIVIFIVLAESRTVVGEA